MNHARFTIAKLGSIATYAVWYHSWPWRASILSSPSADIRRLGREDLERHWRATQVCESDARLRWLAAECFHTAFGINRVLGAVYEDHHYEDNIEGRNLAESMLPQTCSSVLLENIFNAWRQASAGSSKSGTLQDSHHRMVTEIKFAWQHLSKFL